MSLRRFPLAALPTPLQRAARLEAALGAPPLYVKRDDLAGFELAGNKARKLEYLLRDALDRGSDVLVSGGGPGSNHCRATAAAARVAGLACVLVLYGGEPDPPSPNLAMIRSHGAEVRFTGSPDRGSVDAAIGAVAEELRAEGRSPYEIPRGGATPLGAVGYARAADELAGQLAAQAVDPWAVLVATGSGGTQAGLVAGSAAAGRGWRVVGASVSRPVPEARERVLRLARGCARLLGAGGAREEEVEVVDARGPGYGRPSPEGEEAARVAAETEGLLLDPVFTAKAMGALRVLAREAEGPLVFVHTGGAVAAILARAGAEVMVRAAR